MKKNKDYLIFQELIESIDKRRWSSFKKITQENTIKFDTENTHHMAAVLFFGVNQNIEGERKLTHHEHNVLKTLIENGLDPTEYFYVSTNKNNDQGKIKAGNTFIRIFNGEVSFFAQQTIKACLEKIPYLDSLYLQHQIPNHSIYKDEWKTFLDRFFIEKELKLDIKENKKIKIL